MKKNLLLFVFALLPLRAILSLNAADFFHGEITPSEKRYVMSVSICDWGPCITGALINLGEGAKAEDLKASDFEVGVYSLSLGSSRDIITGYLEVESASFCDSERRFLFLSFRSHPKNSLSNPFVSFPASILKKGVKTLRIKNSALNLDISSCDGINCEALSMFKKGVFTSGEFDLYYASFMPEVKNKDEKIPLIVWLHGVSEGGSDALSPVVTNRVSSLCEEEIQSSFGENGAAVLVPQARSSWLESTTKDVFGNNVWVPVDIDGTVRSFSKKLGGKLQTLLDKMSIDSVSFDTDYPEKAPSATISIYTESLKGLICEYVEKHLEIDEKRIYIGGVSAGGYMAINMCLRYPHFFAAAFPVSEVYPDSKITKDDIASLCEIPLWFVHSKDDNVAKIEKYDGATVLRLREAGAKDLHYTLYNCIIDSDGIYFDDDGNLWQYSGHESYIPLFRGEVYDNSLSIFDWLSSKRLK